MDVVRQVYESHRNYEKQGRKFVIEGRKMLFGETMEVLQFLAMQVDMISEEYEDKVAKIKAEAFDDLLSMFQYINVERATELENKARHRLNKAKKLIGIHKKEYGHRTYRKRRDSDLHADGPDAEDDSDED